VCVRLVECDVAVRQGLLRLGLLLFGDGVALAFQRHLIRPTHQWRGIGDLVLAVASEDLTRKVTSEHSGTSVFCTVSDDDFVGLRLDLFACRLPDSHQ